MASSLLRWPDKSPAAVKDYSLSWAARLEAGEEIISSDWAVPPELTEITSYIDGTGAICTVWLSGGLDGTVYTLVNTIVTSRGVTDDKSIDIQVKQQ
jgi:hypothetical protein